MDHLEKLLGSFLFKCWLWIVSVGIAGWAFDLTVTAIRHQFFAFH